MDGGIGGRLLLQRMLIDYKTWFPKEKENVKSNFLCENLKVNMKALPSHRNVR